MAEPENEKPGAASNSSSGMSRRSCLRTTLIAAGSVAATIAAVTPASAAKKAKITKQQANYRDEPRGRARCGNCDHYQFIAHCEVVQGIVSLKGWCKYHSAAS